MANYGIEIIDAYGGVIMDSSGTVAVVNELGNLLVSEDVAQTVTTGPLQLLESTALTFSVPRACSVCVWIQASLAQPAYNSNNQYQLVAGYTQDVSSNYSPHVWTIDPMFSGNTTVSTRWGINVWSIRQDELSAGEYQAGLFCSSVSADQAVTVFASQTYVFSLGT